LNMILFPDGWTDYELIDTGEGKKLERWGNYVMVRPDPRIIWGEKRPEEWEKAGAVFEGEKWTFRNPPPQNWVVSYKDIKFKLKPTDFKHTGVFPEQAVNWEWLPRAEKVLNLFAYTGGATIAAAQKGAFVTHLDASKPAISWAKENAKLSGIEENKIRWIEDDALKFVKREIKRGNKYDGIIMDPPRFGRGTNGEVWKIEENIREMVQACKEILSPNPTFFLINAYTADLSHVAIENLLSDVLGKKVESGEVGIRESEGERILPAGVFARWKN